VSLLAGVACDLTPERALAAQVTELSTLLGSTDHLEAVTAFLEKRAAVFTRS